VLPPLNIVLLILTSKNKSKIKNMCTTNRYMLSTNGNISISGTNMSIVKSVVSWFNKSSIQVDILLFLNFSVKVANTILIEKSSRPISIDSEVDDTGNEFVDNALDGELGERACAGGEAVAVMVWAGARVSHDWMMVLDSYLM
jgi:hypothetical protein